MIKYSGSLYLHFCTLNSCILISNFRRLGIFVWGGVSAATIEFLAKCENKTRYIPVLFAKEFY